MPSTVIVLPFSNKIGSGEKLLGLSIADRFRKSARKAGFGEVLFSEGSGTLPALPEAFAVVSPTVLLNSAAWSALFQAEPMPGEAWIHSSSRGMAVINAPDRKAVDKLFSSGESPIDSLRQKFAVRPLEIEDGSWTHLGVKEDFPLAERWLLESLIKDTEGFMSRHFERKISLSVTRVLVNTSVTPNQMTLISTAIGLSGALFFISYEKWYHVVGALLFWLHSVLDGCDGEIARLKFMESRWGGLLDFWGDNIVHSAVFAGIAYGWYRWAFNPVPMELAFLSVGGTLLSAGLVYWNTMRPKKGSGPLFTSVVSDPDSKTGGIQKVADFLARRDFIYLVILLAAMDRIRWFLFMGAYGAPIYAMVLAALQVKSKFNPFKLQLNAKETT